MMRAAGSLRPVEPSSSIERELVLPPRWKEDLLPLGTILILTLIYNWILLGHYYGYVYAFHDLALITDWFTNALYHSKPFWISEDSVNHLSIHFTPTLVLLIPLYLLSDSSYLLAFLGTLALAASLYLGHRWWMALSRTYLQSVWVASAVSAALAAFIALNGFTKTILDSTHIEIFYLPLFLGFAYSLRFYQKVRLAALLWVLALGIREEAGFYLCLQTLALLFLPGRPAAEPRRFRNRALVFSGCALLYTIIAVKIIFPYFFGINETSVERGWSEWGNSWLQVTLRIVTSPKLLFHHLAHSSFERFNRSFGYIPWLNPAMAALVNAPGLLLYTASHTDKRLLWFYNSSFLFAGFIPAFYAGCLQALHWGARILPRRIPFLARQGRLLLGIVIALALIGSLINLPRTAFERDGFAPKRSPIAVQNASFIRECLKRCPNVSSVAADFRHIVFVPNRVERFLLDNSDKAEALFIFDPIAGIPEDAWIDDSARRSIEKAFVIATETKGGRFYLRRGVDCSPDRRAF